MTSFPDPCSAWPNGHALKRRKSKRENSRYQGTRKACASDDKFNNGTIAPKREPITSNWRYSRKGGYCIPRLHSFPPLVSFQSKSAFARHGGRHRRILTERVARTTQEAKCLGAGVGRSVVVVLGGSWNVRGVVAARSERLDRVKDNEHGEDDPVHPC